MSGHQTTVAEAATGQMGQEHLPGTNPRNR